MSHSSVICATSKGGLAARCCATKTPPSVTPTSSHCRRMRSSLPSSLSPRKWIGRSLPSAETSGRKVVAREADSSEEAEAPPTTEAAACAEVDVGSGGMRAEKWPRVYPRAMGEREQKVGSQSSGR